MPKPPIASAQHAPPLAAVRAFEAAARHQSFTRAAEELGMTQAAVSYQIKSLEDRLGAALFVRQARQVTLTPAGRRLSGPVGKALRALEAAFAEAKDRSETLLMITTTLSLATWLAPRLGAFQAEHPEIAVKLDAANRIVDFSDGEFDVGLRTGFGEWPGLAAHKLFAIEYAPVCTPELRERHGFRTPLDVRKARLIGGEDPWWARWFKSAGAGDVGESGQPMLALGTQSMEAQAALAGHGVAMIMPRFFQEELRSGRLVFAFDHLAEDPHSFWVAYPQERKRQRKLRLFRDWILAEAEANTREIAARAPTGRGSASPARAARRRRA